MGDPVAHSLSPLLHNTAFAELGLDWVSVGFAVPDGATAPALEGMRVLGMAGLSVTMPHKHEVARLVDERTAVAARLGAVNCVVRRGRRLVGDNTDGAGLLAALAHGAGFDPADRRCLVVGAGGAARAAALALAEAGAAEVVVVNRTAGRAHEVVALVGGRCRVGSPDDARRAELVVQATPAGMAGTSAEHQDPLVGAELLGPGQLALDLVYHPRTTRWLAAASARGAATQGGLGMLVHQAAAQLATWTGTPPPVGAMWAAADAAGPAEEPA
jgi:shikimate dehydrogenase